MPNITLVRRRNALALFTAHAAQALGAGAAPKGMEQAFAASLQISPSMWSQIKSARPIGDKLARQIETLCRRPQGWLDASRGDEGPTPTEQAFLDLALAAWRASDRSARKALREQLRTLVAVAETAQGPLAKARHQKPAA